MLVRFDYALLSNIPIARISLLPSVIRLRVILRSRFFLF